MSQKFAILIRRIQTTLLTKRAFLVLCVCISVNVVVAQLFGMSGSADEACRTFMASQKGYGPWFTSVAPLDDPARESFFRVKQTYSDGFQTVGCRAVRFGFFWFAIGVDRADYPGYSWGLDCEGPPLMAYGVIQTDPNRTEELGWSSQVFDAGLYATLCHRQP